MASFVDFNAYSFQKSNIRLLSLWRLAYLLSGDWPHKCYDNDFERLGKLQECEANEVCFYRKTFSRMDHERLSAFAGGAYCLAT